jgi:hypothetical protein
MVMLFFLHPPQRQSLIICVRNTDVFHESIRVHSYGSMENFSLGSHQDPREQKEMSFQLCWQRLTYKAEAPKGEYREVKATVGGPVPRWQGHKQ